MAKRIEYAVCPMDKWGDIGDPRFYAREREARKDFDAWTPTGDEVAVCLERRIEWSRDFEAEGVEDRDFETLAERGDATALAYSNGTLELPQD